MKMSFIFVYLKMNLYVFIVPNKMGADIHVLCQIFDPITKKYLLVRETISNNITVPLGENCRITIRRPSDSLLSTITTEELKRLRQEHKDCEDYHCECQSDFNISFGIVRDYVFFGKIADVRGSEKENMKPRGLPIDIDDVIRETLLENVEDSFNKGMNPCDFHSHTFFYDTEIDAFNFDDNGGLAATKELLQRVRNNFPDNVARFLIAFDN